MSIRQPSVPIPHIEQDESRSFNRWGVNNNCKDIGDKDVPEFIQQVEGFHRSVKMFSTNYSAYMPPKTAAYIAEYKPCNELERGFYKVWVVDEDGFLFPCMEGIWKAVADWYRQEGSNTTIQVSDDGRIYGHLDLPDENELSNAVSIVLDVYDEWKEFPDTDDYPTVLVLNEAAARIDLLNRELTHHDMQKEIDAKVRRIKTLQDEVVAMERELNEKYEKAAFAANLLEEKGYPEKAKLVDSE